jgi:hypothetical protein
MNDAIIRLTDANGRSRRVALRTFLDAEAEERALDDTHRWIKSLRALPVDGAAMRDRFTARGDSLWWFTELYLHKLRVIQDVHRVHAALNALVEREAPRAIDVQSGPILVRLVAGAFADSRRLQFAGARPRAVEWGVRLARLDARARLLTLSSVMSRARSSPPPASDAGPAVAAFVHRAFWRGGGDDGSAESYIGPVLRSLERQGTSVRYVGIGPRENFRARRWWKPVVGSAGGSLAVPIERYAPLPALAASRGVWRDRRANFQALATSPAVREAAVIRGLDVWPLVKEQLAGIAWLQWPWSVRAMDEAAAAIEALSPRSVLTYAEAGGWGRALILEARRRHIPSVGLQHGFIYRHWLNYLHEPDEMAPASSADRGFPYPTRTLVFDAYAEQHLRENGRLPEGSVVVTGSPQRDVLARAIEGLSAERLPVLRSQIGASPDEVIVLLTTKEREARGVLPALIAAVEQIRGARLVIKPHPAETVAAYRPYAPNGRHVTIVQPDFPLATLLALCRALVTVNSTVALDAAVIGIPALVIGLPNNLTPLVEAGALAGAASTPEIRPALEAILYDEGFRQQLTQSQTAALARQPADPAQDAAARSASAILDVVEQRQERLS